MLFPPKKKRGSLFFKNLKIRQTKMNIVFRHIKIYYKKKEPEDFSSGSFPT